jgi:hypothetical protein
LDIDLAAITTDDRCGAAGTHLDGITDIGLDAAADWLEALTLIDREVALAGLDGGGPARLAMSRLQPTHNALGHFSMTNTPAVASFMHRCPASA